MFYKMTLILLFLNITTGLSAKMNNTEGTLETKVSYTSDDWEIPFRFKHLLESRSDTQISFVIREGEGLNPNVFLNGPALNVGYSGFDDADGEVEHNEMSISIRVPEVKVVCVPPRSGPRAPEYCPQSLPIAVELIRDGVDGEPVTILDTEHLTFKLICEPSYCWMRARNIKLLNNHVLDMAFTRIRFRNLMSFAPNPWTFKHYGPLINHVTKAALGFYEISIIGHAEFLTDVKF